MQVAKPGSVLSTLSPSPEVRFLCLFSSSSSYYIWTYGHVWYVSFQSASIPFPRTPGDLLLLLWLKSGDPPQNWFDIHHEVHRIEFSRPCWEPQRWESWLKATSKFISSSPNPMGSMAPPTQPHESNPVVFESLFSTGNWSLEGCITPQTPLEIADYHGSTMVLAVPKSNNTYLPKILKQSPQNHLKTNFKTWWWTNISKWDWKIDDDLPIYSEESSHIPQGPRRLFQLWGYQPIYEPLRSTESVG